MSRYDWGQRHPGIDRLEEQIGEALGTFVDYLARRRRTAGRDGHG
ncbi:MAG TPA: hypothetical protein VFJ07_03885 [Streptosporangiaceae bacterium]|nr:hypothetical protein [Streptosporangiaceae bacterium]